MTAPWEIGRATSWFAACRHKSSGGSTSQTSNEPWEGAKPFLTKGYEAAQNFILDRPTQFFPGSTVVPFSPESTAALGATANRARAGSPVLGAAQDYTHGLLTDPTSSPVFDSVMSSVRPAVDSAFATGGRRGSPSHAEALGRGMTRGIAPYMESAAGRAPALAREDYYDIDRLAGVGRAREAKAGEQLADSMARWDFGQREPAQRAQSYGSTVGGLPMPMASTTRTSQNVNPLMFWSGTALQAAGK